MDGVGRNDTEKRQLFFRRAPVPMLIMTTEESTLSVDKKTPIEIYKEIENIRNEIIYYIDHYLPQIHMKVFVFGKDTQLGPFAVIRDFRMMCLMFQKRLKKYNLDPRQKVLIFLNPKCRRCGSLEDLAIHHRYKDGKADRSTFDDYEVYIWTYYLIHLEEAQNRLTVLCKDCHEQVHNGEGGFMENIFMEMFGF